MKKIETVQNLSIQQSTTKDLFIDTQAGLTVISTVEKKPNLILIEPKNRQAVANAIYPESSERIKELEAVLLKIRKSIKDQKLEDKFGHTLSYVDESLTKTQ